MSGKIKLTKEQDDKMMEFFNARKENPPSITEIIVATFGYEKDGRSKEGMAVKEALADKQIVLAKKEYVNKTAQLILTDEQKEYVKNNFGKMSTLEMARILFDNSKLTPLSSECRVIKNYVEGLPAYRTAKMEAEYRAPTTIDQTIFRLKKYLPVFWEFNFDKATPKQKADIHAVKKYLNTYRFIYTMNNIDDPDKRELLESAYLSYICDKCDLTAEEVDAYLNLSLDVVNLASTQEQINKLTDMLKSATDDPESKRISMSLAESIHNAQTEYNQNKIRQQKLSEALQGKRSERINMNLRNNASILNLVALWREHSERGKLIDYAKILEKNMQAEVEHFTALDEAKVKIFGINPDELVEQSE